MMQLLFTILFAAMPHCATEDSANCAWDGGENSFVALHMPGSLDDTLLYKDGHVEIYKDAYEPTNAQLRARLLALPFCPERADFEGTNCAYREDDGRIDGSYSTKTGIYYAEFSASGKMMDREFYPN